MSNSVSCSATSEIPRFVRYFAALPFDRLRANGSFWKSITGKNLKPNLGKLLAALALLALISTSQAGTLSIENAESLGDVLYLRLNFAPNADVLEALDASVPLKFVLTQRVSDSILVQNLVEQTITLSYAPLLERFELTATGTVKPYRLRAELLDAFSNLELAAIRGAGTPGADTKVRLSLSIGALPAPLRLPAMLDSDWWLDSGWVAVRTVTSDAAASATKQ